MAQASTPSTWEVVAERTGSRLAPTEQWKTRLHIRLQEANNTKHPTANKPGKGWTWCVAETPALGRRGEGVAAPGQPGLCSEETRWACCESLLQWHKRGKTKGGNYKSQQLLPWRWGRLAGTRKGSNKGVLKCSRSWSEEELCTAKPQVSYTMNKMMLSSHKTLDYTNTALSALTMKHRDGTYELQRVLRAPLNPSCVYEEASKTEITQCQ